MNIDCPVYEEDTYLLYTCGFSQILYNEKLITILGEVHGHMNRPEIADGQRSLEQTTYIRENMLPDSTLVLAELPRADQDKEFGTITMAMLQAIRSYNLTQMLTIGGGFPVLNVDIRPGTLRVPNKPQMYIDVIQGAPNFHSLKYEEWKLMNDNIRGFLTWVANNPDMDPSLQQYVRDKIKILNQIKKQLKTKVARRFQMRTVSEHTLALNWKSISTLDFVKRSFIDLQMAVLDINMLVEMYRFSPKNVSTPRDKATLPTSFDFVVGDAHRRNLEGYFRRLTNAQILSSIGTHPSKNYINLKGTYKPLPIIRSLKDPTVTNCVRQ